MATSSVHPVYRPNVVLRFCKNESDKGVLCKDAFKWPKIPGPNALWVYLQYHVDQKDWLAIRSIDSKQTLMNLTGSMITQANVTKMQRNIATGSYPVTIRLVLRPGAKQKTRTPLPPSAGTTLPRAPQLTRPATETAGLRELLRDLDNLTSKAHKKYRV